MEHGKDAALEASPTSREPLAVPARTPSANGPRILCVGAATWDTILGVDALPSTPTEVLAEQCVEVASGMATSAAITVAALGGRARIMAALGDDANADRYLSEVEQRGVDTAEVRRVEGARTALSTILVDAAGERLVCPYYDPRLRTSWFQESGDDVARAVETSDAVLCDVRWPDTAEAALIAAHRLGKINVLDVGIAPPADYERLVPQSTHVIFARAALATFAGQTDPERALQNLNARGIGRFGCLGVTLGEDGFLGYLDGALTHRPAPPAPSPVIDTLAAGDIFLGAFILRLTEGAAPREAVDFALAAATLKCTRFGGNRGTPTREALEHFLAQLAITVAT